MNRNPDRDEDRPQFDQPNELTIYFNPAQKSVLESKIADYKARKGDSRTPPNYRIDAAFKLFAASK